MRAFALGVAATTTLVLLWSGVSPAAAGACSPILTPEPLAGERCGSCADEDGDELIDAEDPECCPRLGNLDMQRVRSIPGRLSLRALLPAGIDPRGHEVHLVVSRQAGPLLCREVAATSGRRRSRRGPRAALRPAAGGRWALEAAAPVDGAVSGALRVTLRVGERCLGTIAIAEPPHGRLLP